MPIYIADYLGDTRFLSLAEHGAYLLLMFQYWRTGCTVTRPCGLPDCDVILARICSATVTDWETVAVTVRAFFKPAIINGKKVLIHKRIEQELDKARSNYEKRVAASARANQAKTDAANRLRAKSVTVTDTATVTEPETVADTVAETVSVTQLRTQNSEYKQDNQNSAPPSAAPLTKPPIPKPVSQPKGTRWEADAAIPPNWILEGEKSRVDHNLQPVDLILEAHKFANYWSSKTGKGATHADWKRTWLNWALNAKGHANGRDKTTATDNHLAGIGLLVSESRARNLPNRDEDSTGEG